MKHSRYLCCLVASVVVLSIGTGCIPIVGGPTAAHDPAMPPPMGTSEPKADRDITKLTVAYAVSDALGKNSVIGYFDEEQAIFYIWNGVVIPFVLTPEHDAISRHGILLDLDDIRMKRIKVVRCDPPVRLISLGKGRVGVACVDRPHATFYRWKGIQFDSKSVPGTDAGAVLDPDAMNYGIVEIDAPKFTAGGK